MKVGDKVLYLNEFKADIVSIAKNGITIEFWGRGFKEGKLVRRRVRAKYLTIR